ncbi:arsenic resistance protein ArsH [Pyrenophora tritici-repentis Pt-1C-BFP]|uniref:Arsenic resistance protein ArsH n=1 Tax=Pyrenophora tritici-repentis (strain Pt-1C-BFP) TaxID=426418 RepID=B2VVI9_PYRTR|nr:arsenic resistance protein ArsH [Pyrenophora tritici-repentis Pt-1C-BFP]EDU40639.1 arsenic resistance protein ArsH [Pyrenophora tritici-repentis Pt-1C-BFP]
MSAVPNGDLNNTSAERIRAEIAIDTAYQGLSLAIPASEDDAEVRRKYRPFVLEAEDAKSDWISQLELSTALKMVDTQVLKCGEDRLRVLVLHGSMRQRSYSRLLAYEASRILFRLGCDVRMYDPAGLPVKDDDHSHPKVQELRDLSKWSDGHVWISPEQHGNLVCISRDIYRSSSQADTTKDGSVQESNRLDSSLHWLCSPDTGSHPRNRSS